MNSTISNAIAITIWLIENTILTFEQIANFTRLDLLTVEAIANEEIHKSVIALNPISMMIVSQEEITLCEADKDRSLELLHHDVYEELIKRNKKNTQVMESKFKKQAKPEAILWIIITYPKISDYNIAKLLNSSVSTVKNIRKGEYWDYKRLTPKNPISLNLCKEEDLLLISSEDN